MNWSYKITDPNHPKCGTTLWSGRYTAVCGMVIFKCGQDAFVLANLRGPGTPDYQGYWNLPCGFLESNETGEEGVCREIFEECGLSLAPSCFSLLSVETDPQTCNNGNVTIRYITLKKVIELPELKYTNINGEDGEVESVKWININEIDNYKWAFNHDILIKSYEKIFSTVFR